MKLPRKELEFWAEAFGFAGSALPLILPRALLIGLFALLVTAVDRHAALPDLGIEVTRLAPVRAGRPDRLAGPVVTFLVALPLLAIDKIGTELQDPFSSGGLNHLPLDDICGTVERNLLGMLDPEPSGSLRPGGATG